MKNLDKGLKVSVIMPVYNAEKYLKMSVGSLVNQTLKDIEIICINDNSKDGSLDVLQQMQKRDSRIIVLNNEVNLGAAETRNKGISAARGEYIVFLDSDDFFYPEMLETAYKEAVLQEADLVVWGYQQLKKTFNVNGEESVECVRKFIPASSPTVKNRVDYLPLVDHVPWNKLVRTELLEQKNIRFQNLPTNDDVFFSLVAAYEAGKIIFVDKVLVDYYWMQKGSLSYILTNKKNYVVPAYRKIFEHIMSNAETVSDIDAVTNYILESLIWTLGNQEKITKTVKVEMEQELQNDSWLLVQFNRVLERHGLWSHNEEFLKRIMAKKCVVEINPYLYYIDGINALCKTVHSEDKKVALWGYGKIGKGLLDVASSEKPDVDFIVDEDVNKQGSGSDSCKVVPYESIMDSVDVIIVTTIRYFEEIRQKVEDKTVVKWNRIRCEDSIT